MVFNYFFFLIFIWVHRVLAAAHGIFIASCRISLLRCQTLSLWCAGLAAHWRVDNSSLTRNWTLVPCIARQILNHWTTGKSLWFSVSNEGTEFQNREKMAEPGLRDWSAWPTAPALWFSGADVYKCMMARHVPASFSGSLCACTWVGSSTP